MERQLHHGKRVAQGTINCVGRDDRSLDTDRQAANNDSPMPLFARLHKVTGFHVASVVDSNKLG
jgi:hypothetical protein